MSRVSARVKILLAAVGLLAVAAAAPFAWGYVSQYLKVGLAAGEDPYAGVTIVHRQLPPSTVPDEWATRLEKQVGEDLGLTVRQDWRPGRGDGSWANDAAFRTQLATSAVVPGAPDFRVMGVVSNAADADAVAAFGTIHLVWFQTPVDADHWIRSDPAIFTDATAEKARTTWWAGFDVISYAAPTDGTDLTDEIDSWVRSITACPNTTRGCTVPPHIATAGATPTP